MRVLVLRALGLGDLLTAVPALRGIRAAHPSAQVALVGPTDPAALLPPGLVDDVVDASWVRGVPVAPLDLPAPDLAVNLHGRGPQSTALLAALRPGRLVAFGRTARWRADEHEVARWCRLVTAAGMPADPARLDVPAPPPPAGLGGAVVVHPGAALPSRRWPAERWAQVVAALSGERVLVTGGPQEVALAEQVAGGGAEVIAGRTSARELAGVVGAARLLVAPDTGVAHLATALGTPSVVLFGPTPPALWGPPPDRPQHRVLWAGRRGDNAAPHPDSGLLEIPVAQVVAAAKEVLGRRTVVG